MVTDVGDALRSTVTFKAGDPEVPTDPTTVAASVRAADGTITDVAAGSIVKDGVGVYSTVVTPTAPGVWVIRWVGTGAVTATHETVHIVRPLAVEGAGIGFYAGSPETSPRDQVRLLVGDTDNADLLLLDLEIDFLLGMYPDPVEAAIAAANAIAGKFSRLVDGSTGGDLSRSYSQKAAGYRALADQLRKMQTEAAAAARVKASLAAPVIARNPSGRGDFSLGMMDNPGTALDGWVPDRRAGE